MARTLSRPMERGGHAATRTRSSPTPGSLSSTGDAYLHRNAAVPGSPAGGRELGADRRRLWVARQPQAPRRPAWPGGGAPARSGASPLSRETSSRSLYPGRPAPGSGPDFQDALLITGAGELVRGDVEVHVRQSDWRSHGHHLDHRYGRVALHLFLQGGDGATRHGGRRSDPGGAAELPLPCPSGRRVERSRGPERAATVPPQWKQGRGRSPSGSSAPASEGA